MEEKSLAYYLGYLALVAGVSVLLLTIYNVLAVFFRCEKCGSWKSKSIRRHEVNLGIRLGKDAFTDPVTYEDVSHVCLKCNHIRHFRRRRLRREVSGSA